MSYKILETCIGCTACTKRCPTDAISGVRNSMHIIDPELCIDCGACAVVCPVECIADEWGDIGKGFPRREWPKAIVIEDNCIGSGCAQTGSGGCGGQNDGGGRGAQASANRGAGRPCPAGITVRRSAILILAT